MVGNTENDIKISGMACYLFLHINQQANELKKNIPFTDGGNETE